MEAELVSELPAGGGWRYEPKWDGFRGVLENDGGELALWSRNGRPLLRYFPELRPLGELMPTGSALDGEIVIARDGALDFDAMQMRLHPAESRVRKLAAEIPATFVAFDLLLWKGKPVHERPIEKRRAELEKIGEGFELSPVSDDVEQGTEWLRTLQAAGFDGVVAKKLGLPYLPGSRDGVVKVKPHKTADCVVAGIRWKKGGRETIATLLLGLYDNDGHLDYVGSAAVGAKNQAEIAAKVLPLVDKKSDRRFSEPNRWGTGELEETPLKPKLVVEVRFDKLEKHRFRHGTRLLRFRPDKDPKDCTWREVRPPRRRTRPGGGGPAPLAGSVDYLAVHHGEHHRQFGQLVRIALDRVLREDREVGGEAGPDPAEPPFLADGDSCARRVALESGETVDRLVVVRTAVALSRRTAKPCCCQTEARVEARDRPVGTERDERAGLSQRADRKGTPRRGALRAEPPRPVVGAVGLAPEHVLRLHRGDNPLGGEARQVLRLQRLDVLDPVPAMQRWRPRLTVCVERLTNAAVARRVRRALEAGAREGRDRPTIVLRVGPERQLSLAFRVGLVQPARSRIDHAVDEELRDARPPAAAAGVAVPEQVRPSRPAATRGRS